MPVLRFDSTFAVRFAVQLADGRPRTEDQRIPNPLRYTNWHGLTDFTDLSEPINHKSKTFRARYSVFRPTQHLILSIESLKCES